MLRSGLIKAACKKDVLGNVPLGHLGQLEDMGQVVLASPMSNYITGADIRADGC
jgi:hypothetical protein